MTTGTKPTPLEYDPQQGYFDEEPPAGGWERAHGEEYTSAGGEFLLRTRDQPPNGALAAMIDDVRGGDPRATPEAVCELIPDRFEYSPGATFVGSTVDDCWTAGGGVCQDFVHLALILLRRHGIAARYVSGYLFAAGGRRDGLGRGRHPCLGRGPTPGLERRRAGLGGRRSDEPHPRRRDAREDRPWPLLR